MSTYYQYQFVSVQPIIALVKEEFKSYIDTGAVDDLLFPIYVDKCLQKLGRGSYDIRSAVLNIDDFQARLPDDFFAIREAWLCTDITESYRLPGAVYQEVETCTTRVDLPETYCTQCDDCARPNVIKAVYKTTGTAFAYFHQEYLLRPGQIPACNLPCSGSEGPEVFDIQGNKFKVYFRHGKVYTLYYSTAKDCDGYSLVPDNFRIKEYIEAFLKQKIYENLANQVTDETFNQINNKAQQYKQMADEAFIMAQIETKKDTVYDKRRRIIKQRRSLNKYNL